MTTVVAIARGRTVVMAADRATNVYDRPVLGVVKIRRHAVGRDGQEMLLGYAGNGALPSVVASSLTVSDAPEVHATPDELQLFADAIAVSITQLAADNYLFDNGSLDGTILMGFRGYLWTIAHMQAIPHHDGIGAVGSGEETALGAIDACLAMGRPVGVVDVLDLAVRIACTRDRYSDFGDAGPYIATLDDTADA